MYRNTKRVPQIVLKMMMLLLLYMCLSIVHYHQQLQQEQQGSNHVVFVQAYIYMNENNETVVYPSLPAAFGQTMKVYEDNANMDGTGDGRIVTYIARVQFLSKNPYLCNSNNIVVANTTTNYTQEESIDENVSIFVPPSPIRDNFEYLNNNTNVTSYEEVTVPAALLVIRGGCEFIQKARVAQALHPSIGVIIISNNVPEDEYEIYMRGANDDDVLDTELIAISVTNYTGMAIQQLITDFETLPILDQDNNYTDFNITTTTAVRYPGEVGGPIILFDAFYRPDHPINNNNIYDPSAYSVANWSLFLIAIIIICSCLLLPLIRQLLYGGRLNTNTTSNDANNVNSSTTNGQQRRLLTKDEVLQFATTTIRSKPSSSNGAATTATTTKNETSGNDPSDVSTLLPDWYLSSTATSPTQTPESALAITTQNDTIPPQIDDDNDHDDQCCSICLNELSPQHQHEQQDGRTINHASNNNDNTNIYHDESTSSSGNNNTNTSDIAQLPCYHAFHLSCIVPWLTERQSYCPLCKYDLLEHFDHDANGNNNINSADTDHHINTSV